MNKLTADEIREPNVEYIIPDGTPIPEEIQNTLAHYIGKRVHNHRTGKSGTRYSIPAYLARDWLARYD